MNKNTLHSVPLHEGASLRICLCFAFDMVTTDESADPSSQFSGYKFEFAQNVGWFYHDIPIHMYISLLLLVCISFCVWFCSAAKNKLFCYHITGWKDIS